MILHRENEPDYIGTGFVLSETAIVTAGHCVYDHDKGEWYDSITVIPAYDDGSQPYGSVTVPYTKFVTISAWIDNGDATQDWGLIKVDNTFVEQCGSLGLRYQAASYQGQTVTIAGYPKYVGTNLSTLVSGRYMYTHNGAVTTNASSYISYANLDTSGGQSGAPVVKYYSSTGNTAIAIHRGVHNYNNTGVRLSEWLYNYLVGYTT